MNLRVVIKTWFKIENSFSYALVNEFYALFLCTIVWFFYRNLSPYNNMSKYVKIDRGDILELSQKISNGDMTHLSDHEYWDFNVKNGCEWDLKKENNCL